MSSDSHYRTLFTAAFPGQEEPYTLQNVAAALASFQRSLVSARAPYDHFLAGDEDALSASAKAGFALFSSPRLGCANCDGGLFFSSADPRFADPWPASERARESERAALSP